MSQGNGAKNTRPQAAETESSGGLVGDLLRRATSPEVLAGVAGAAAAAHFTKHAVDQSQDEEPGEDVEAHPEVEDERDEDSRDESADEEHGEEGDDGGDEEEDEPEEDDLQSDEDDAEPREEAADRAEAADGSLGSDDERTKLLARAREYAQQLTGHPVESVSGLAQDEHGWRVRMEVVEVARVPSTTDVIASYEAVVTCAGELVDFRRAGRYYRNATDGNSG